MWLFFGSADRFSGRGECCVFSLCGPAGRVSRRADSPGRRVKRVSSACEQLSLLSNLRRGGGDRTDADNIVPTERQHITQKQIQAGPMDNPWIQTTTVETFQKDVIEQSQDCPVVVDFWAEWCQPCQQLMPLLEKVAADYNGRFVLMKINVDELPEIAQAFGVQSIPFVVALVDGQPVSKLPGVVPEDQLRQWLDSFLPSPGVEAYNAGLQAEGSGDLETAEEQFRKAATLEPDAGPFQIALGRVLLALDRDLECGEVLERLEARGFLEPEAETLKEQLEMRSVVEDSGGTAAARDALEADPENIELKIRLAEALAVDKRYPDACELLLEVIRNDRTEVRDRAKDAMVTILAAMGPKSRQAADYRRQLATAFY